MTKETMVDIQNEIDSIKEYIETELCKKCEEMSQQLKFLESLLKKYETDA